MRGVNEPEVQYNLYKPQPANGGYAEPKIRDDRINSPYHDYIPFVPPDGSFLLFSSDRPKGFGLSDLYMCFMKKDGNWTESRNLGKRVNTSFNERFPSISPNGEYLFFVSNRKKKKNEGKIDVPQNGYCDIYWVDAKIIKEFKPEELK